MSKQIHYVLQIFKGNNSKFPIANLKYRISFKNKVISEAKTDAKGNTRAIHIAGTPTICLEVFNPKLNRGKGGYILPIIYNFKNPEKITLGIQDGFDIARSNINVNIGDVGKNESSKQGVPFKKPEQSNIEVRTIKIFLKPYLIVSLFQADKRLFKTRLYYDVLNPNYDKKNPNNKDIINLNGKLLKGLKTMSTGRTDVIYVDSPVVLRFYDGDLGQTFVYTEVLQPFYSHENDVVFQYMKVAKATTAPNIKNTTLLAGKENIPIIIDPVTNEIYVLSDKDFREFIEISSSLSNKVQQMHLSREAYYSTLGLQARTVEQIKQTEKEMKISQDEVIKEFNKQFKNKADLKEVMAFEMFTDTNGGQKLNAVRKYTKTSQHINNKNNKLNKFKYKLGYQVPWENEKSSADAGIKSGKLFAIDKSKFKENFIKSIEDLSIDVYKAKGEKSVTLIPDPKIFGKISTELAESYQTSDSSTVDVHAQWLRLVAGTGYDGTVKWGKDGINASGSAYAQAKIVLYEGKKKWLWACPSLEGFILAPNGVDLGAIRFICGTEVSGFSGAVFAASSAFSVSINPNDGKQYLSSISRDPKETILNTLENGKRAVLNTKKGNLNDDISSSNHFNAGINAFAGIQANIAPFGGLQWLDPEKPKDFSDLAKISPTVGLSAGYGVAGDFSLYFREGAFRFRASLALCVGWGGKGALEFTVDMKKFLDLMKFISYQLTYATFKQLTYMLHEDFMTLHKISMMLPFENFQKITKDVEFAFAKFIKKLDIAEERIKACHKINAKPQWLKYLTPESRGSLLYHITRHGLIARLLDPSEEEGIWLFGTNKLYELPRHKEAVLNIFQSVTQVSHWTNTLQHIAADGTKSTKSIAENEKEILKFLNLGVKNNVIPLANLEEIINKINQDHNFPKDYSCGNKYIDEYIKMRGKRVLAYPKGYMITTFDSPDFKQIQIAAGLERPNSFLVQAPKALEDSDLAYYFDDTGTSRMA